MKISINDQKIFELSETQRKVIQNDISSEIFEADMKRRLEWVLMHKYEECFKRLKQEWEPKFVDRGIESIPTNPDAFANLVFIQTDYRNRYQKEIEAKQQEHLRKTNQI